MLAHTAFLYDRIHVVRESLIPGNSSTLRYEQPDKRVFEIGATI